MDDLKIWRFIFEKLCRNQSVILLCVLNSKGSSPGRQGFKMAVSENDMIGSIGGGIMEHKYVELAKSYFIDGFLKAQVRNQIHNKSASKNQSGMICSGEQINLLLPMKNKFKPVIESIINAIELQQQGSIKLTMKKVSFASELMIKSDYSFKKMHDTYFVYNENIGSKNQLYIIGGGHCALALSQVMHQLNFDIHIVEERQHLNTFLQNTFAKTKTVVDSYLQISDIILSGNKQYVVIMTMGYRTDEIALKSLLNNDYKYLGVLGSKTKMQQLLTSLLKEGYYIEKIKKIHAPIGINIKSETPQEIAISIAAEIIAVKNN